MPPLAVAASAIGSAAAAIGSVATAGALSGTAAAVAGTALVGSTALKISNDKKRASKASADARRRQDSTNEQMAKLSRQNQIDSDKTKDQSVRNQARSRQRQKAASSQGRSRTILTSPLGVTGSGTETGGKTLLGT